VVGVGASPRRIDRVGISPAWVKMGEEEQSRAAFPWRRMADGRVRRCAPGADR
jgi:hypothetical protein